MSKEAHARIKINKLLEGSGWRFFDDLNGKANITLEPNIKLTQAQVSIPSPEELKTVSEQMTSLLDKQIAISKQSRTLEKLRDTLLPKLMSGEVWVAA